MTSSQNNPREFDAILGGDAPPLLGAVLDGVEGVKQRLASSDVETRVGALSEEIGKLELPALEYFELWFSKDKYIGEYDINKFITILHNIFPKLRYLGLRKYDHDYPDYIALTIADSPICENLIELDLSMGKIGDEGANALLNCPAVRQLDTLNISHNRLTDGMVEKLNQLNIEVISEKQEPYRYWSTYE